MTRDEFIVMLQRLPRESNVFVCDENENILKMRSIIYENNSILIKLGPLQVSELEKVNEVLEANS